jgi:hypothetical protein
VSTNRLRDRRSNRSYPPLWNHPDSDSIRSRPPQWNWRKGYSLAWDSRPARRCSPLCPSRVSRARCSRAAWCLVSCLVVPPPSNRSENCLGICNPLHSQCLVSSIDEAHGAGSWLLAAGCYVRCLFPDSAPSPLPLHKSSFPASSLQRIHYTCSYCSYCSSYPAPTTIPPLLFPNTTVHRWPPLHPSFYLPSTPAMVPRSISNLTPMLCAR